MKHIESAIDNMRKIEVILKSGRRADKDGWRDDALSLEIFAKRYYEKVKRRYGVDSLEVRRLIKNCQQMLEPD